MNTSPETQTVVTVNSILDQFAAEYIPNLSPRTQKDYAYHLKTLRHWFGHRIADELVARDFREFMAVPHGKRGRIQRNRQMAVLSCAFSEAVGRWYTMARNPCKDVKRHQSKPRTRYVTDAEFDSFKRTLPLRIRLAMELALLIGQRQGDILRLTWERASNGVICIQQSKTGKRLAIEITPTIAEVLERCRNLGPEGSHVIRKRNGTPYTSEGFRAIWQRYQRKWVAAGNDRFTFHDLRGKCASDCPTIELAYELLGHTSMAMTRRIYDRGERLVKALR